MYSTTFLPVLHNNYFVLMCFNFLSVYKKLLAYAFGVSLMTVCKGMLMYGKSACGRLWKYAYLSITSDDVHNARLKLCSQTPEDCL